MVGAHTSPYHTEKMGTLGDWFLGVICEANRHPSEEKMEDMVVWARKTEEKRLNTRVEADMFGPSALGFLRGRLEEISAGTDEMQGGASADT